MKIVIIIPTYNEKGNIAPMINALEKELKQINKHQLSVLYVDDTSPDGTYKLIRKYQKKFFWVHLLLNKRKLGLGAAYITGINYAIKKLKADAFIEFDADFQHQPSDLKKLISAFDQGYDYVIGSRYIKGGSIPRDWGFNRKFLSVVGNLVARMLLLTPKLKDVTTGFKLTRVKGFANKLSLEPNSKPITLKELLTLKPNHSSQLISNQFAYKIQILHEMVQARAKIKEVPINFQPRKVGESKIISNEMLETLRVIFILQLRNPQIQQFIKFGIVGFIGYLIQASSLQLLTWFNMPEVIIWGGSAELAIISNFTLNNLWTFKHLQIKGLNKIIIKFLHFNLTTTGAIIIQIIAGSILVKLFGPQYRQLYLPVIIVFLVIPYNYFIYTKFIWKKSSKPNT